MGFLRSPIRRRKLQEVSETKGVNVVKTRSEQKVTVPSILVKAKALAESWSNHSGFDEVISHFKSPSVSVYFEDFGELTAEVATRSYVDIVESFPDVKFSYEDFVILDENTVNLRGFRIFGTHTGAPFQLADLPPVQPTGKFVANDPESVFFHFQDGELVRVECVSLGNCQGPMGLYGQLTGELKPLVAFSKK